MHQLLIHHQWISRRCLKEPGILVTLEVDGEGMKDHQALGFDARVISTSNVFILCSCLYNSATFISHSY